MKCTLSVLVENQPGIPSKVSGLSSRHAFNVDSLAMGVTENSTISHMTIVVNGDKCMMEQVGRQLNKPVPVIKVKHPGDTGPFISCELALTKVSYTPQYRPEVIQIAELLHAHVVGVSLISLMIQFADATEKIETMSTLLKPYGIKEITRAGTVALGQRPQVTRKQSI